MTALDAAYRQLRLALAAVRAGQPASAEAHLATARAYLGTGRRQRER